MKKQQRHTVIFIAVSITIVLIVVATYFSDFLGARFMQEESLHLSVRQGEVHTLELAPSEHIRKLEICTEKRNPILRRSDLVECRTLKNVVDPLVTEVGVIIPRDMPLGRAVVITRILDTDNVVMPILPPDEKIPLWVDPPHMRSHE